MSRKNFLRFRPSLESLDVRAMPSTTLMLACATGVHVKEIDTSTATLTTPSSDGQTKGDIEPVVDQNGDLWLCRETDNSCECIPW